MLAEAALTCSSAAIVRQFVGDPFAGKNDVPGGRQMLNNSLDVLLGKLLLEM